MAAWLPPEVLLNVASRVTDISVLLAMRLVCRDWALVVKTTLESWACLSLHEGSMDTFDNQFRHRKTRHPIINAAIIVPDRNYWHVSIDAILPHLADFTGYLLKLRSRTIPGSPPLITQFMNSCSVFKEK